MNTITNYDYKHSKYVAILIASLWCAGFALLAWGVHPNIGALVSIFSFIVWLAWLTGISEGKINNLKSIQVSLVLLLSMAIITVLELVFKVPISGWLMETVITRIMGIDLSGIDNNVNQIKNIKP